jgi:hypothetical protein
VADTTHDDLTWLRRTRSAVLLVGLVVVLGALVALVLGVAVVGGASLLDHALG